VDDKRARRAAGWRADPAHTLALSRRCAAIIAARFGAATLTVLRPDEAAWLTTKEKLGGRSPMWVTVTCALDAADYWPTYDEDACDDGGRGATLGVALRAVLHAATHGFTLRSARDVIAAAVAGTNVTTSPGYTAEFCAVLLHRALQEDLLPLARFAVDESALRALAARLDVLAEGADDEEEGVRDGDDDGVAQRAGAARGGAAGAAGEPAPAALRRCALASCAALEPHARAFRVCAGMCGGAVCYCSREHQKEDWKRHKKAGDGCGQKA
jgi:hypothetical protein